MYKLLILAPLVLTAVASADVFDINAAERGWVCSACGFNNNGASPDKNYLAGFDAAFPTQLRNWFEFDIPNLSGATITSATFSLYDGIHEGGGLTFAVYGLSAQPTVFTDVTSADPFGSVATNNASLDTTLTITLNAAAIAAIEANQGGSFFIGGIDSGETSSSDAADFGSTQDGTHFDGSACPSAAGGHCATTLDFTTTSIIATPEPPPTLLTGAVLLILAGVMFRRRSKAAA